MNLTKIRKEIEECENIIIFNLLERSRTPFQPNLYKPDALFFKLLKETEQIQEKLGRYTNPQEQPFIHLVSNYHLPKKYPYNQLLSSDHKLININPSILTYYTQTLLPSICNNHINNNNNNNNNNPNLNTLSNDIFLLQTISKRCHLGKMVAAIKLKTQDYSKCQDDEDIFTLLTNNSIENQILNRIKVKTETFISVSPSLYQVPVKNILDIFKQIILFTKNIQVQYIKSNLT